MTFSVNKLHFIVIYQLNANKIINLFLLVISKEINLSVCFELNLMSKFFNFIFSPPIIPLELLIAEFLINNGPANIEQICNAIYFNIPHFDIWLDSSYNSLFTFNQSFNFDNSKNTLQNNNVSYNNLNFFKFINQESLSLNWSQTKLYTYKGQKLIQNILDSNKIFQKHVFKTNMQFLTKKYSVFNVFHYPVMKLVLFLQNNNFQTESSISKIITHLKIKKTLKYIRSYKKHNAYNFLHSTLVSSNFYINTFCN